MPPYRRAHLVMVNAIYTNNFFALPEEVNKNLPELNSHLKLTLRKN